MENRVFFHLLFVGKIDIPLLIMYNKVILIKIRFIGQPTPKKRR